jgi:FKBP-type peptidyl-prolyl cis-trans isomerase
MIRNSFIAVVAFVLVSVFVLSCKKNVNQAEIDHGIIEKYVIDNQLDGDYTASGLYYEIINPGHNVHPTVNSTVTVAYKGYSIDGVDFDEGDHLIINLTEVIQGWQEGLQFIGETGKIKLVIPSGLAYGESGNKKGTIKPNEVLVFEITMHYFSK